MYCTVEGISYDGSGVARNEGLVIFIPGALPGEQVEIEITGRKKNFARAGLVEILHASPDRISAPCPYYGRCGGCAYQHVSYDRQLELKRNVIQQALQRIGKIKVDVKPAIKSAEVWRYRNKVTWHVQSDGLRSQMGYYQTDSHDLLPIKDCLLISEAMQSLSSQVNERLAGANPLMSAAEIVVRKSSSGKLMLIMPDFQPEPPGIMNKLMQTEADSICLVKNGREKTVKGSGRIEQNIGLINFALSPLSFFQVNNGQAGNLVNVVREFLDLQGNEKILDAYCGIGTLALSLAGQAGEVTGIESFSGAVEDARLNARLNNISNCRFLCGPSEKLLPTLDQKFDAIIVDPPRSGCRPEVIQAIGRHRPDKVVYVSCEPSTLARDLAHLTQAGYRVDQVQPVDMFPQTRHVETVVLMSRVEK